MFHVEHTDRTGNKRRRHFGGGHQNLRGGGLQEIQDPSLMVTVQLRAQIVQTKHRPVTPF